MTTVIFNVEERAFYSDTRGTRIVDAGFLPVRFVHNVYNKVSSYDINGEKVIIGISGSLGLEDPLFPLAISKLLTIIKNKSRKILPRIFCENLWLVNSKLHEFFNYANLLIYYPNKDILESYDITVESKKSGTKSLIECLSSNTYDLKSNEYDDKWFLIGSGSPYASCIRNLTDCTDYPDLVVALREYNSIMLYDNADWTPADAIYWASINDNGTSSKVIKTERSGLQYTVFHNYEHLSMLHNLLPRSNVTLDQEHILIAGTPKTG